MSGKIKILVADDEPVIRMFVRANLSARGYDVFLAKDGAEALELAERHLPDLIILDISMPVIDGIEVCRNLRAWTDTPIIILSIRGEEKDKVLALNEGADDYITKPFGIEELIARINVALRHVAKPSGAPIIMAGELEIDLADRSVKLRGQRINLTRTEFKLLAYLAINRGKSLTHSDILHGVWGSEYERERELVRVFIGQLRRKIEIDPLNPRFILTRQGLGYQFTEN